MQCPTPLVPASILTRGQTTPILYPRTTRSSTSAGEDNYASIAWKVIYNVAGVLSYASPFPFHQNIK